MGRGEGHEPGGAGGRGGGDAVEERRGDALWHPGHVEVQWLGGGMVVQRVWLQVRGAVAVYEGVCVWVWRGWALDGRHCVWCGGGRGRSGGGCIFIREGEGENGTR